MVQAARSGVQNIAEGSRASGTSKKFEIKLTNVARASLEELLLDYEDFLRQRGLTQWDPKHPALLEFKRRKPTDLQAVREWVQWAIEFCGSYPQDPCESVPVRVGPCKSSEAAANAALSLLNLANYLLDRQVTAQAESFLKNGGFSERLYNARKK
jgi:four helix bundle suffix protein